MFFSLFPFSPSCTCIVPSARWGPRPHLSGAGLQSAREVPPPNAIVRVERFWWWGRRSPFAVRPAHLWRCVRPAGELQKGDGCWKSEGDTANPSVGALSGEKSAVLPGQGLLPFLIGPGPFWLDFGFCLDHCLSRIGPHSPSQVWALFDRASFSQLNFGPFWLRSLFSGRTSYSPVGLCSPRSNLLHLRLNARFPS